MKTDACSQLLLPFCSSAAPDVGATYFKLMPIQSPVGEIAGGGFNSVPLQMGLHGGDLPANAKLAKRGQEVTQGSGVLVSAVAAPPAAGAGTLPELRSMARLALPPRAVRLFALRLVDIRARIDSVWHVWSSYAAQQASAVLFRLLDCRRGIFATQLRARRSGQSSRCTLLRMAEHSQQRSSD